MARSICRSLQKNFLFSQMACAGQPSVIALVYKHTLTGSVLQTHTLVSSRDAVLMASVLRPETSFFESEHSSVNITRFSI
jgi:O-succinylbenzoate synthase